MENRLEALTQERDTLRSLLRYYITKAQELEQGRRKQERLLRQFRRVTKRVSNSSKNRRLTG
jgi:hypothetical protein